MPAKNKACQQCQKPFHCCSSCDLRGWERDFCTYSCWEKAGSPEYDEMPFHFPPPKIGKKIKLLYPKTVNQDLESVRAFFNHYEKCGCGIKFDELNYSLSCEEYIKIYNDIQELLKKYQELSDESMGSEKRF